MKTQFFLQLKISSLLLMVLFSGKLYSQEYSLYAKKIEYTEAYDKAKTYRNVKKAIKVAENVESLKITIYNSTYEYLVFMNNYSKFSNLKKLVIENWSNDSTLKFVQDLSVFKDIEYIRMMSISIPEDVSGFDKLQKLQYLDLSECGFESVPKGIFHLKHLQVLNLSMNKISFLDSSFTKLDTLKELDISNNNFDSVPEVVCKMKSLLYFDYNNAENILFYPNGREVYVNRLRKSPECLFELENLRKVSFYKVPSNPDIKTEVKDLKGKVKVHW